MLNILGGGPAGLAVAFYAKKNKLPFTLYEAGSEVGGNARTLEHRGFLFDTGAHRLHDKHPEITQDIKELLGDDLKRVQSPSQIFYNGHFIDFPLSPLNLLKSFGFFQCIRAAFELLAARLQKNKSIVSFEDFALRTYGRSIADAFLLGYSEKLWGAPCAQLSPRISGSRMKGLNLNTFIKELFRGKEAKTEHLDGTFYYPIQGIGMIADGLASFSGEKYIRKNAKVTRLYHDGQRIEGIEINGQERVEAGEVISTLPLPLLLELMQPSPGEEVLSLARKLRFRNVVLVAVFLDKESITKNASVYFPSPGFIFTRVYEPKNRSARMAPQGKTSLVAEVPCSEGEELWRRSDDELAQTVCSQFQKIGWFQQEEIIGTLVKRIRYAYPILEIGCDEKVAKIAERLNRFENLKTVGRSAEFVYTHIHDLLREGKELVAEAKSRA